MNEKTLKNDVKTTYRKYKIVTIDFSPADLEKECIFIVEFSNDLDFIFIDFVLKIDSSTKYLVCLTKSYLPSEVISYAKNIYLKLVDF